MPAMDLLQQMQATRIHLALVVDEYGGTDGLVSIEDLVEQIVGDIDDEHDSDQPPDIVQQADGSFIADARASLEDVTSTIGEEFNIGEAGDDVDTIGGYLTWLAGRLPLRGEVISGPEPFEIEVLDADPRRIKRVRISRSRSDAVTTDDPTPRGRGAINTAPGPSPSGDAKPAPDQQDPDDTAGST
jgi:CBS domain containing-hemolysin-like protein